MNETKKLARFRDYCRERADWQAGQLRLACKNATAFGTPKAPDHVNCGSGGCGCSCHAPTDHDRELFRKLADEIDAFLAPEAELVDLFDSSP